MLAVMQEMDYDTMVARHIRDHEILRMAHTLYDRVRSKNPNMVPWRYASKVVKREFILEAKQELGLL